MSASPTSMHGRTVLLTGFTAGLGRAAALELASMGADLVGVCRNREKGEAVARDIRAQVDGASVEVLTADLGCQADIRRAAKEFLALDRPLHVLWNNAGVINLNRQTTVDGLEMTFAVNHIGPFLLTSLLLERLRESGAARVVATASGAYRFGGALDFDDLQWCILLIFQPMFHSDRNINRLVFCQGQDFTIPGDRCNTIDDDPMFSAVLMPLQADLGTRINTNKFNLKSNADLQRLVPPPGPVHLSMGHLFIPAFGL